MSSRAAFAKLKWPLKRKTPASAAQAPDGGEDWLPPLGDALPTYAAGAGCQTALFTALHMA